MVEFYKLFKPVNPIATQFSSRMLPFDYEVILDVQEELANEYTAVLLEAIKAKK